LWAKVFLAAHPNLRGFLSADRYEHTHFLEISKKSFFLLSRSFYICRVPKEGQQPNKKYLENSTNHFFYQIEFSIKPKKTN